MRLEEVETLDLAELESRWDELRAFIDNVTDQRELAAGCLALGRVHQGAGRFEEAWAAYREAARHYAACGLAQKARGCDALAEAVGEHLPFASEQDLDAAFDNLGLALIERGKSWHSGSPAETDREVRLLEREVFRQRLQRSLAKERPCTRVCTLASRLSLEPEDVEVLLLLQRMETDARWDRTVRALGHEEFLPAPSARLLCRFLSGSGKVSWEWARRFSLDSPLVRWGLVELLNPTNESREAGPWASVRLGPVALAFLSHAQREEVIRAAGGKEPGVEPVGDGDSGRRERIAAFLRDGSKLGYLLLSSPGRREPLEDLAACAGPTSLLRCDVTPGEAFHPQSPLVRCLLAARLLYAVPVVVVNQPQPQARREVEEGTHGALDLSSWARSFASALASCGGGVVIVAQREIEADLCRSLDPLQVCTYARPSGRRLEARLDAALAHHDLSGLDIETKKAILASEAVDDDTVDELAREIAALARSGMGDGSGVLRSVVRSRTTSAFLGIAERLNTNVGWEDLVLPDDVLVTLNEIITFARYRDRVMNEWGFAQKMPYGRALSALFHGPPGTGKTLAACVLANDLGVDVYRIDLSQIVSKWVGETEKNLARVFDTASRSKAIILFDEADSLFGKRTEVRTAVDRYSNLEVNYLLQRLEDFDGVTVLTTNFPENIDSAFKRRIRFKVAFPFPDAQLRSSMWRTLIPPKVPQSGRLDFGYLGAAFEFAGAHIRNAILRACFRAAAEDRGITQADLIEAARAEAKEAGILVRA